MTKLYCFTHSYCLTEIRHPLRICTDLHILLNYLAANATMFLLNPRQVLTSMFVDAF